MDALLSPEGGLAGVALASFLAATLVPLASEAVLFGYLRLHPDHAAAAIAVATSGNTAGGMSTYLPWALRARADPGKARSARARVVAALWKSCDVLRLGADRR